MTSNQTKTALSVLFTTVFSLTSCLNNTLPEPTIQPETKTLNSIETPVNFNWTTSQTVKVEIKGLPTTIPIRSTIHINGTNNSYYTGSHLMSDTLSLIIEIPVNEKELTLNFGTLNFKSPIIEKKVLFSFIPNI